MAATTALSFLRIICGLNAGIEIHLINAGLPWGTRRGVPRTHVPLDVAEFLHGEATPDTAAFWCPWLGTITTSSKLIAQDAQSAGLPSPNRWAKPWGSSILGRCHWLPADCRITEECIHLTHGGRQLRCHIPSGYAGSTQSILACYV